MSMEAKRNDPTAEELAKALRLCATYEPAERYPCESCYLYPYRDGNGETSAGQFCHMTLALDAGAALRRLEAENAILRAQLARATAERDAVIPSTEVLTAIDELVEFARTKMGYIEWMSYANVLGEWRSSQKGANDGAIQRPSNRDH